MSNTDLNEYGKISTLEAFPYWFDRLRVFPRAFTGGLTGIPCIQSGFKLGRHGLHAICTGFEQVPLKTHAKTRGSSKRFGIDKRRSGVRRRCKFSQNPRACAQNIDAKMAAHSHAHMWILAPSVCACCRQS